MITTWTRHSALGLVVAGTALYALAGVPLTARLGSSAGPFSVLPVALAAGLLGWRGGLALTLLCIPLNTLFLNLAGVTGWDAMFRNAGGPGLVALLAVAFAVGGLHDLVARLRAVEAALRAGEERHRAVVDTAFDAIITAGADGRIQSFNRGAERVFGHTAAEVLGQPLTILMPEQFRTAHEAGMRRYQATGTPTILGRTTELVGRRKDGAEFPLEATLTEGHDGGGGFFTGVLRDISERQAAEATLRESEARFRLLAENAEDSIFRYRFLPTRGTDYISPSATAITGYTPEEHYADPDLLVKMIHPDGRDQFLSLLPSPGRPVATAAAHADAPLRWCRKDGSTYWGDARVTLVRDAEDRVVAIEGILRDVTARVVAEAAVRTSEAHFRSVVETLTDGVVVQLADGSIRTCNASAECLLGLTVAQMERRVPTDPRWQAFGADGHPFTAETHPAMVTLRTGVPQVDALMGVNRPDGGVTWISVGTHLLHSPGAAASYAVVSVLTDITARKAATEALRASEATLAEAQRLAHLGSWEYDIARRVLRWSDEVFRIGGHLPGAFVPTPERMLSAVHPDDQDLVRAALAASLERGEAYDLDHRIVRPDGEIRIVHQQAEIVRDATGRPLTRVGIIQDVTERRALEAQLQHQAFHDVLTGLPNRALFLDRLDHALTRARRGGPAGAVLFLDLDRFKDVNDSLGHDAGDRLLVAVAGRLRRCLRDEDTLARLGGDEFTVLLEDVTDAGAAARLAERLAVALDPPIPLEGQEHRVTASVGIVLASGDYGRAEEVLRDADVAMYRAKAAGKARYAVFDPAMQTAVQARLALEQDLRRALERGEFVLHYQPIVDLWTGCVVKVEALVRWQHPERGLVLPGAFLPLAEEAGLVRALGRWVLREACRQGRAWQVAGYPLTVAVNLTAQEFQGPDLVEEVAAALREVGLAPQWLTLEITEGAAMGDAAATVATLGALRALGVGVAIDDFGTGYSSLAYLQRFPVDALKVDKTFVDGLGTATEDTAIVEAVVTLARTLGLGVVAEGVETAAQAARLAALGCGLGQGYHFARPLPPEEIPALLARRWPVGMALTVVAD